MLSVNYNQYANNYLMSKGINQAQYHLENLQIMSVSNMILSRKNVYKFYSVVTSYDQYMYMYILINYMYIYIYISYLLGAEIRSHDGARFLCLSALGFTPIQHCPLGWTKQVFHPNPCKILLK